MVSQNTTLRGKKYRAKVTNLISAVQLDLDTQGFTYQKWGDQQTCQAGDWLVRSGSGDCYTITNASFLRTYQEVSPGRYRKHTTIQATQATTAGKIKTQEGTTAYEAGDYLIKNNEDGTDNYAISQTRFHDLYELVD